MRFARHFPPCQISFTRAPEYFSLVSTDEHVSSYDDEGMEKRKFRWWKNFFRRFAVDGTWRVLKKELAIYWSDTCRDGTIKVVWDNHGLWQLCSQRCVIDRFSSYSITFSKRLFFACVLFVACNTSLLVYIVHVLALSIIRLYFEFAYSRVSLHSPSILWILHSLV